MADVWAVPVRIHRDSVSEELENTARKIALSFSCTDNAEAFLINFKNKLKFFENQPKLLETALINIPYDILDKISILFNNDPTLRGMITEEILNRSMKQCEFIVRRKRLKKQEKEGKKDKLLRLKQKGINFIPIYSTNGHVLPSFRMRNLTQAEMEHPFIHGKSEFNFPAKPAENQCSVVPKLSYFKRHFDVFSQSAVLAEYLSPSVMAMGGSVLACLLPPPPDIMEYHQLLDILEFPLLPLPNELIEKISGYLLDYRNEVYQRFKTRLETYFIHEFAFQSGDVDIFVSYFQHSTAPKNTQLSAEAIEKATEKLIQKTARMIDIALHQDQNPKLKVISPKKRAMEQSKIVPLEPFVPKGPSDTTKALATEEFLSSDNSEEDEYQSEAMEEESEENSEETLIDCENAEHVNYKAKDRFYYVKSPTAITFCGIARRNIQIIDCGDRTPEDTLMDFDIDCVTFAYDGEQVYALPRGRRAINTWCNFMDPFVLRFKRSRNRVAKYHNRGFSTLLFENCIHEPRCDVQLDPSVVVLWNKTKVAPNGIMAESIQLKAKWEEVNDKSQEFESIFNRMSFCLKEQAEESDFTAENPNPILINPSKLEDEFEQDDYFYRGDMVTSFLPDVHEIVRRIDNFSNYYYKKHMHEQRAGERLSMPFAHGDCLHPTILLKTKSAVERIPVGKDPKRVGHACYMCKQQTDSEYRDLICSKCHRINKKHESTLANFEGKVALVTGVRIKLGYAVALRLLRNKATVVGLTRFPKLALHKFRQESDSSEWMHRLFLHGVDLRSTGKLVEFLNQFKKDFKRIDIIINNAAQTIHRPPNYYRDLFVQESYLESIENTAQPVDNAKLALATSSPAIIMQLESLNSSQATQIPVIPADCEANEHYFPANKQDAFGEPLDGRPKTSWTSKLGEINYGEVLETQLVNVVAPFTIINELMPLIRPRYPVYEHPKDDGCNEEGESESSEDHTQEEMLHGFQRYQNHKDEIFDFGPPLVNVSSAEELYDWPPQPVKPTWIEKKRKGAKFWELSAGRRRKIIVNVSSPEGDFLPVAENRFDTPQKKGNHPHTDMAKAALNMLTNTSANDLARYDCYIFSVDTGWFSDMRPLDATPVNVPLTTSEAAARVLHPVFEFLNPFRKIKHYGCMYRNFKAIPFAQ